MRRIDIINSVMNIQKSFNDSQILDFFLLNSDKIEPVMIMESYQKYIKYYDNFDANEKKILDIFGLSGLESASLWARIITGDAKETRELLRPFFRGGSYIKEYLINIVELLKQDNLEYSHNKFDLTTINTNIENKEIISVILPEAAKTASHPERLVMILQSIDSFYKSLAIILDCDQNDLSVIAIDSGSDKSFDFLGAAKVVSAVKELIIELWDRVVFYKEKKLHERIELISQSLPVIEKIKSMEDSGSLAKEQGELLRRNILSGTKNFLNAGAILPEFSYHNVNEPRKLMTPEAKLLSMPENISEPHKNEILSDEIENEEFLTEILSEEEKQILQKLIAKQSKKTIRKRKGS
ncbi:MAG TPA: hypothetical protein DIW37_14275 [Chryseobacterium sp.]|nr:hypothetical protein [Chryseobacterium sp.]